MTQPIAALFVQTNGAYFGIDGVDPWDETRDARLYAGPHPVVAHPPCARWCRLAGLVEAVYGYKKGVDGGCFESALASVRAHGGVLEHPAWSDAWPKFDLPKPSANGWQRGLCGGWVCQIDQCLYGHRARKSTWLYAVTDAPLPRMAAGKPEWTALVSDLTNRYAEHPELPRLSKREASRTPSAFKSVLIGIARSAATAQLS